MRTTTTATATLSTTTQRIDHDGGEPTTMAPMAQQLLQWCCGAAFCASGILWASAQTYGSAVVYSAPCFNAAP